MNTYFIIGVVVACMAALASSDDPETPTSREARLFGLGGGGGWGWPKRRPIETVFITYPKKGGDGNNHNTESTTTTTPVTDTEAVAVMDRVGEVGDGKRSFQNTFIFQEVTLKNPDGDGKEVMEVVADTVERKDTRREVMAVVVDTEVDKDGDGKIHGNKGVMNDPNFLLVK